MKSDSKGILKKFFLDEYQLSPPPHTHTVSTVKTYVINLIAYCF